MTYMCWSKGSGMKVEVRGQLCEIVPPLPSSHKFQGSNSGVQALKQQVPLLWVSSSAPKFHYKPQILYLIFCTLFDFPVDCGCAQMRKIHVINAFSYG